MSSNDSVENQSTSNQTSYGYDEFGRVTSLTTNSGAPGNYSWVYDRWGNRTSENPNGTQFTYNTGTNQAVGLVYDAAGNLAGDGSHAYTFDAEGNVVKVDYVSPSNYTAVNTYDALNRRVRINTVGGTKAVEFIFNPAGQHSSSFDVINHLESEGWAYWGAAPVVFYASSTTQFQFQDWLGTERMRRKYDGSSEGSFTSLPFGSGSGTSGSDLDQYHFAGLDHDSGSNTDHAQFRQYANAAGRWMSPDPYSGSYDVSNPQTLNRYAYVGNNPLSATDVSGLMMCNECFWGSGGPTNVPSDGGLSMGGWDGMYGLWDVGPNGAMFAGDPDTHSGPWGGGGGSGHVCILGWCVSWGSGVPTLGFPGNTSGIWNEGLGLPAGMRLPVGDPAQTIQQVFGLPTMADVNCLPFAMRIKRQITTNNKRRPE